MNKPLLETAREVMALDARQFTDEDFAADYQEQYENRLSGKTALASALLEAAGLLKHYRPIIEKYGHTQGNMPSWFEELLGPIDSFLAKLEEKA